MKILSWVSLIVGIVLVAFVLVVVAAAMVTS